MAYTLTAFYRRRTQMERVLQAQINLCEDAQRGLAQQVVGGLPISSPDYVKQVQAISKMVRELVAAKIDYASASAKLAGSMGPDDVLQAALDRIMMEPVSVVRKCIVGLQAALENLLSERLDLEVTAAPPQSHNPNSVFAYLRDEDPDEPAD